MEDFYAHIDDYKNGLLEGQALRQFETEMARNASLKLAVENYDEAKDISEGLLEVDMMETLSGLKDAYELKNGKGNNSELSKEVDGRKKSIGSVRSLRRWISAASFIGVMMFAGWWVMDWNEEMEYREDVLANYEKPYDEESKKSVEFDTTGLSDFQIGKGLFMLNKFEESISWFEKHISESTDKELLSKGHYWLGSAYLELWIVDKAIEEWEKSDDERAIKNLEIIL